MTHGRQSLDPEAQDGLTKHNKTYLSGLINVEWEEEQDVSTADTPDLQVVNVPEWVLNLVNVVDHEKITPIDFYDGVNYVDNELYITKGKVSNMSCITYLGRVRRVLFQLELDKISPGEKVRKIWASSLYQGRGRPQKGDDRTTIKEIHEQTGISHPHISDVFTGKEKSPSIRIIDLIVRFLGGKLWISKE